MSEAACGAGQPNAPTSCLVSMARRRPMTGCGGGWTRVAAAALVLACCCGVASAIYEDQVGEFDWVQQHVGAVTQAVAAGKLTFVGTDAGVVACLNTRTGALGWRQVLESDDLVDSLLLRKRRLVSVSSCGRHVRMWYASTGGLVWDAVLDVPAGQQCAEGVNAVWVEEEDDSLAIAIAAGNQLTLLDAGSGEVVWTHEAPCRVEFAAHSPLSRGKVFALCRDDSSARIIGIDSSDVSVGDNGADAPHTSFVVEGDVASMAATSSSDQALVVATITADGGVVVTGAASASSASLSASTLGSPAVSVSAGDMDSFIVELESGSSAWIAVTSEETSAQVSTDASVDTAGAGSIQAAVVATLPAAQQTIAATRGIGSFGATVSISPSGTSVSVVAEDGSTVTTQVPSVRRDTFGVATHATLFPFKKSGSSGNGHRVIVTTSLDHVLMFQLGRNEVVWTRDEAFGHPTAAVIVDAGDKVSPKMHAEEHGDVGEVLDLSFGARVALQMQDASSALGSLISLVSDPVGFLRERTSKPGYRTDKTIVVQTNSGRTLGVSSLTGAIRWSVQLAERDATSQLLVTRLRTKATHPPEVLLLTRASPLAIGYAYINTDTGDVLESGTVPVAAGELRLVSRMAEQDPAHRQLVVLVDAANSVHVLPPTESARAKLAHVAPSFVFSVVENGVVEGHGLQVHEGALQSYPVWSIVLPEDERVVAASQVDPEDVVHTPARILGDASLLLKYLNPNLLVVATSSDGSSAAANGGKAVPSITIRVVDAVSGRLVESRTHRMATGPVALLMHENWIQYTYWNHKTKVQELASLVLYEGTIASRELHPLKSRDVADTFSSYHTVDAMVTAASFVLPVPVNALAVTRTAASITNRWLLMGLDSGGVMCLDRRLVDPRRPTQPMDKVMMQREGLMPYQAHLPVLHTSMISYNLTVARVRFLLSQPTALESTTIVAAVGLDTFSTRVHPSKEFDILSSDFNKPLLLLMSGGLLVATVFASLAAKRKRTRAAWA